MNAALEQEILSIIKEGKDLTLATLREDGWPQATTVSYASDGMAIYFGCSPDSQKARNLTRDPRISLTIDLPYKSWGEIRGLSIGGRARRLTAPGEMESVGALFLQKFSPEIEQYLSADAGDMSLFQITPEVVSVLDYRKGFGHSDLVQLG